jgi:hypothetical protein
VRGLARIVDHRISFWRVAGGALVAGLLVSCGTQTVAEPRGGPVPSESDVLAVDARADGVYLRLWGTAEQKEAAHYLEFLELNRPTVDCMRASGYPFVPHFTPLWTGWEPDGTETNGWLGHLDRAQSGTAIATDDSWFKPRGAGYEGAMDRCANQETTAVLDGENPAGTNELSAEFHELLDTVNEQLDPIDSYQDCMSDRGIDVGFTGQTGATGLSLYLQGHMPTDQLDRDVPTEAWSKYLSLETDALAADRACRADNYLRGLRLLDKPLAEFEEQHDAALRGAEAAWREVLQTARKAGLPTQG